MKEIGGSHLVHASVQPLACVARLGHGQRRFQQADIPNSPPATIAIGLVGVQRQHFIQGEEVALHSSASRLNAPPYRRCASATTRLSLAVRCRLRTGEIRMTCPSVDTSSGVFASIPTWSSRGLSSTRARLFPVLVSFFRTVRIPQFVHYAICVRTDQASPLCAAKVLRRPRGPRRRGRPL